MLHKLGVAAAAALLGVALMPAGAAAFGHGGGGGGGHGGGFGGGHGGFGGGFGGGGFAARGFSGGAMAAPRVGGNAFVGRGVAGNAFAHNTFGAAGRRGFDGRGRRFGLRGYGGGLGYPYYGYGYGYGDSCVVWDGYAYVNVCGYDYSYSF